MPFCLLAQSKKDIRKNGVKGITEVVVEYENGKEVSHNDVSKKFDKEGEVILEVNYDKNGALKDKTATKFNRDGDKIEEATFDATGKQINRFASAERAIINEHNHCGREGKWFEPKITEAADLDDLSTIPFGK